MFDDTQYIICFLHSYVNMISKYLVKSNSQVSFIGNYSYGVCDVITIFIATKKVILSNR